MYLPISRVLLFSCAIVSPFLFSIGRDHSQQDESTTVPAPVKASEPEPEGVQPVENQTGAGLQSDAISDHSPSDQYSDRAQTPANVLPDSYDFGVPLQHVDPTSHIEPAPLFQSETLGSDNVVLAFPSKKLGVQDNANQVCLDVANRAPIAQRSNLDFAPEPQHPAPKVVLQFGSGCTDAMFTNWKLTSHDKPCAKPAIPHGPMEVDVLVDKPVDFAELMFDGKPLKPSVYANQGSLHYAIPCPAPGQHWLQARYLSDNVWSHYSKPIRFEVRLPAQPRIIAASDFDRDPTPLARNSTTSITTHSIKVHLANVSREDHVVAYIDGKPLPQSSTPHTVVPHAQDDSLCCRVFRVEGVVTPGVHKLTVRVVGCGGVCSITSEPSDPIAFQYYNEDVYLLRPDTGCVTCTTTDALAVSAPTPSPKQNKSALPSESFSKRKLIALTANHTLEATRIAAKQVLSSSSPFYFASAAHFPLREFGIRGESLDRDGIIIYEDMAFHFDHEGNYEVHFRASAPNMPASVRLQFQIQPHSNSPWYTVTLAPIEFPYPAANDENSQCSDSNCGTCDLGCNKDSKDCCGKARECVCRGHSEILRRCYNEMSQDAKIRRSGSARIGFGVDLP